MQGNGAGDSLSLLMGEGVQLRLSSGAEIPREHPVRNTLAIPFPSLLWGYWWAEEAPPSLQQMPAEPLSCPALHLASEMESL